MPFVDLLVVCTRIFFKLSDILPYSDVYNAFFLTKDMSLLLLFIQRHHVVMVVDNAQLVMLSAVNLNSLSVITPEACRKALSVRIVF